MPCPPLSLPDGQELLAAVDTLVGGIHLPEDTPARDAGHKALAVNLSDMAAMGGEPLAVTLTLWTETADAAWVREFQTGFQDLARRFRVNCHSGHRHPGPLQACVAILGGIPRGQALRRDGAAVGDLIYVTGTLGDAGLGLGLDRGASLDPDRRYLLERLRRPSPRVAEGQALLGIASAAIDVSDGLAADLGHILERSGVGATLRLPDLPLSSALRRLAPGEAGLRAALSAGDDYELCFTVPPANLPALKSAMRAGRLMARGIGHIDPTPGLRCLDAAGCPFPIPEGYQHFALRGRD